MKLVAVFTAACLLLLATLAWLILAPQPHEPVPAPPAPRPHDPAPTVPELTTLAVEPLATQATVHWATDPALLDAQRRLERAQQVLLNDPNHEQALRDKAAALADLRQWSPLADALGRLIEFSPHDAGLRYERATVLMQLRQWLDALGELKLVVAEQPDHGRAWFNLAAIHQELGHLADARQAWDRAIELSPTAEARARRGEVLLDLHEWAAAEADFETVLAEQPRAPDATLNLALALAKLGRPEEATTRLRASLDEHPRHVLLLNRLAELAAARCAGDDAAACDEAAQWCQRSLAIDSRQPEIQTLFARVQSGRRARDAEQ